MSQGLWPAILIAGAIVFIAIAGEAILSGPRRSAASEHYQQSLRVYASELTEQSRRQQLYHALYQRPSHFPSQWNAHEFDTMHRIWQQISRDFPPGPEHQQIVIHGPEASATFPMPRHMASQDAYRQLNQVDFTPNNAISILATIMNDPIDQRR